MTPDRAFPKPWSIVEVGECFKVVDATGFPVCYVYFEDEAGRADRTQRPNRKQAGALTSKIAQLPELLDQKE